MNASFKQYAETLDSMEVLRVTISKKGEYDIPSEKDGRIALVDPEERARLRQFLLEFCQRLEFTYCDEPQPARMGHLRPTACVLGMIGKEDWMKITRDTAKNAEEYAVALLVCGDKHIESENFNKLLDRAFGKPAQPIRHTGPNEGEAMRMIVEDIGS
jgi:hypothetical protein